MVNTDRPCKDAETAVGAQKLLSSTFGARLMELGPAAGNRYASTSTAF